MTVNEQDQNNQQYFNQNDMEGVPADQMDDGEEQYEGEE